MTKQIEKSDEFFQNETHEADAERQTLPNETALLDGKTLVTQPLTVEEQSFVDGAARRFLQAAAQGAGIAPVLEAAQGVLGLPISLADTLFHKIAFCGMEGVTEADCERNDKNDPVSRRKWMRTVKGSREPVVDEEGGVRYRAMCFDVCVQGMELAKLSVFEVRPFRVSDREILKVLASALACVLTSVSPACSHLPNQLLCDLLHNLVCGRLTAEELLRMEQVLELPAEARRRILALEGGEDYTFDYPAIQMHCFQRFGMTTTLHKGRVFCLLEEANAPKRDALERFLQEHQLQGGLSRTFLRLSDVPDFAKQAAFALDCAKEDGALLTGYEGCLLRDVAARCKSERSAASFCRPEILTLYDYDQRYGTHYTRTLQCYCENLCNMANTARASFLHYNTVKYRLKMIREICGVSQIGARDLFEFLLTFSLLGLPSDAPLPPEPHKDEQE